MKPSVLFRTLLSAIFLTAQFMMVPAASAAFVSTDSAIADSTRAEQQAHILAVVGRDQVRNMLAANGVSSAQVEQRLNRMSNAEIAQLSKKFDDVPAGEGALELVIVVFLVLILLELLGVIDIFPRI